MKPDYLNTSSTFLGTSSPSSTVTASGVVGPVFLVGHFHVGHGTLGEQQYFRLKREILFSLSQHSVQKCTYMKLGNRFPFSKNFKKP